MIGAEAGTSLFEAEVHTLPMVNDSTTDLIWEQWGSFCPTEEHEETNNLWRNLYILNASNQCVEVYNLTLHNLSNPANFAELKQKLIDAAGE